MQPFIAEALRVLTQELCRPRDTVQGATSVDRGGYQILDTSVAEAVRGGSLVFPNPTSDSEPDWCVLALLAIDPATRVHVFGFRGRLPACLAGEEFVDAAYQMILGRKIDESGRKIYPPLLEKRTLLRRDILKILAGSSEAHALDEIFVIVSDPSPWLSKLGVAPGEDSSFPALAVLPRE